MSDIVWGRPINVDGDCPSWLYMDTRIERKNPEWPLLAHTAGNVYWPFTGEIRVPANHFAYLAIAKGYQPWGGGYSAPEDWDGSDDVILRNGNSGDDVCVTNWDHCHEGYDIIGYKRKKATGEGDYVSVKRMTEAEARGEICKFWDNMTDSNPIMGDSVDLLRHFGLIREPTQAETIAAKTGLTVDQVQSVLNEVNNGTR